VAPAAFTAVVAAPPADTTKPVITAAVSPASPNGANGWYVSPVGVSFTCADTGSPQSGIATDTVAGDNQTLSTDGTGLSVASDGNCIDAAGNVATVPVTVSGIKLDQTKPTITASILGGTTGANGWYTSDVVVHYTCADNLSGVVSCPADVTLGTEGTAVAAPTPTITDNAGNVSLPSNAIVVKIDKTAPTAALVANGTEGDNGWYVSDVTVDTNGTDSVGSPVTCTSEQEFDDDTDGTDVNGSCTNDAGLVTNAAPITLKIDTEVPTIVASITGGTEGDHDWYTSDVTVHYACDDNLSGAVDCPTDEVLGSEGAAVNAPTPTVKDAAGNESDEANAITVKIDQTGPSAVLAVTAGTAGANGWYVTNVTVGTSGTDSVSSPVTCTANQSFAAETSGTAVNGSCTNDAGLTTNATPLNLKIDKTAPVITIATPVEGASYVKGSSVTASWSATDALSGVGSAVGTVANGGSISTTATGSFLFTVNATDVAGNPASVVRHYTVFGYDFGGFKSPLAITAKDFKQNSTIPVKFQLLNEITHLPVQGPVSTLKVNGTAAKSSGGSNDADKFRYDLSAQQYIYNLATKSLNLGNNPIVVTIPGVDTFSATIVIK
jgi:hypothetical protein